MKKKTTLWWLYCNPCEKNVFQKVSWDHEGWKIGENRHTLW